MEARTADPKWRAGCQRDRLPGWCIANCALKSAHIIGPGCLQHLDTPPDIIRSQLAVPINTNNDLATRLAQTAIERCGHNAAGVVEQHNSRGLAIDLLR